MPNEAVAFLFIGDLSERIDFTERLLAKKSER